MLDIHIKWVELHDFNDGHLENQWLFGLHNALANIHDDILIIMVLLSNSHNLNEIHKELLELFPSTIISSKQTFSHTTYYEIKINNTAEIAHFKLLYA